MSDNATKLLEELGANETGDNEESAELSSGALLDALSDNSEEHDKWHILLVELAYVLNASFRDVHYWEGVKSKQDTFRQFVKTLHELDRMPEHDKSIHINYRGSQETDLPAKSDYIIQFGERVVDYNVVAEFIRRQGLRFKHFEGRIRKAFEAFSEQAISSVTLKIPGRSRRSLELMKVALRIFSCYNQAAENLTPISYEKNGNECSLMPISNEYEQPDPNLTLLAALNDMDETAMQDLVSKLAPMINEGGVPGSLEQGANVYSTIFQVKTLRQKLIRPPLEVNSNASLASYMIQGEAAPDDIVIQPFDSSSAIAANMEIEPAAIKNGVAQFAKAAFKGSLPHAKFALKSVYARDYDQVDMKGLGQRLKMLAHLLKRIDKHPKGQKIIDGVLETVQSGVDQVSAKLLDDLVVRDNQIKIWSGDKEVVVAEIDDNLQDILEVSKERSKIREINQEVINPYENIEEDDYQALAERFNLETNDAEQIITLFKKCFDRHHNFQRTNFINCIPEFLNFERHIFEILWHFLKETPEHKDRLPFLNAFQFLIRETQQPLKPIKILLSDFIMNPSTGSFSDRNAMMLVIQFLRTYNKEEYMDIEITPEEVLLVKIGLNRKVADYAAWRVDGEQKHFLEKIVNIRKQLVGALDSSNPDDFLPVRLLLALEREVHIFLALAGGNTAALVLRSALKVYGNPESQIFHMRESTGHLTTLIQHLAVLIRGFGRVGSIDDLTLLDEIEEKQERFVDLNPKDKRHEMLIKRTMGWINMAKNEISSRSSASETAAEDQTAATDTQRPAGSAPPSPDAGIAALPG